MEILGHYQIRKRSVKCVVIRRGDVFYADLRPVVGSEQGGVRPVLIIQNDIGKPAQPYGDLCGHHFPHEQGEAADSCGD